jgi:hypothetical protein
LLALELAIGVNEETEGLRQKARSIITSTDEREL